MKQLINYKNSCQWNVLIGLSINWVLFADPGYKVFILALIGNSYVIFSLFLVFLYSWTAVTTEFHQWGIESLILIILSELTVAY